MKYEYTVHIACEYCDNICEDPAMDKHTVPRREAILRAVQQGWIQTLRKNKFIMLCPDCQPQKE